MRLLESRLCVRFCMTYPAIICATGSRGDGYPFTMIRNQRKAGFAFALFLIA